MNERVNMVLHFDKTHASSFMVLWLRRKKMNDNPLCPAVVE
jgi:hypothetical protein